MEDSSHDRRDAPALPRAARRGAWAGRPGPPGVAQANVADAASLAGASVRLCKGIYVEPESIQFQDDQAVRASFVPALETLLDGGCYAAIATHDEWLVDRVAPPRANGLRRTTTSSRCCSASGRSSATDRRRRAQAADLRPYGRQWYEYSLRRLQENPKIAGYVAGDLGRSLLRGASRSRRRRRTGATCSIPLRPRSRRRRGGRTGPPST